MSLFQKQTGDIVELTQAGVDEIGKYKNNYTEVTKPNNMDERHWSAWDMGNLWIGMLVSIAVYQVASGLIVSGMSWAQALVTIVLGHSLVMIFAVILEDRRSRQFWSPLSRRGAVLDLQGSLFPSWYSGQ